MSTQTPNLNLDLREGTDIFNPLSTNANFETLDSVITEIRKKGGVPTYTTTASANLLKLSENPVPNETLFKFVAAGDANTWSYQETVNNIVALDGSQKTIKGGEMYVAWVNAANAMVVIAWPDVVNAQTFDGKEPAEWATKAQLDAVNQTAANATTTAQAAATVANNALEVAGKAGLKVTTVWTNPNSTGNFNQFQTVQLTNVPKDVKFIGFECASANVAVPYKTTVIVPFDFNAWIYTPRLDAQYPITAGTMATDVKILIVKLNLSNVSYQGTAELSGFKGSVSGSYEDSPFSIFNIFAIS